MIILISGGAKNGKTSLAQDLAAALSPGKHYYLATMIPVDGEDRDRIRRHIADRAGMGFETVECGRSILSVLDRADPGAAFLLDSTTALLMNELFPAEKQYRPDPAAARRCADDMESFVRRVADAVIVSDCIYDDAGDYDETTELYRKCLADMDRRLARISDTVIEMTAGNLIIHKGELP